MVAHKMRSDHIVKLAEADRECKRQYKLRAPSTDPGHAAGVDTHTHIHTIDRSETKRVE